MAGAAPVKAYALALGQRVTFRDGPTVFLPGVVNGEALGAYVPVFVPGTDRIVYVHETNIVSVESK